MKNLSQLPRLALGLLFLLVFPALLSAEEIEDSDRLLLIEFRSLLSVGGQPSFSFHDPVLDRTFWLKENESRYGFTAGTYDDEANTVTVSRGDYERDIPLATSRIVTAELEEPEAAEDQDQSREEDRGRRRDRRNRSEISREELDQLGSTLLTAAADSERMQEIITAQQQLMRDARRLSRMARAAEEDSEVAAEARKLRESLREEYREVSRSAQEEIGRLPNLSDDERESLSENFIRILWRQERQQRREASSEQMLREEIND